MLSKTKNTFCIFLSLFLAVSDAGITYAQSFYDINTIQRIEIGFSQPDWDYQLDTAKYGAEGYILADWVVINGQQFDSVGVKYKGNSSYDSTYIKNPMHISLDKFRDQSYQGYSEIKLGNQYSDPSMIREVLAYSILKNYMHCPKSNFTELFINGNYIGIYSNDESIGKKFCSDHFYSSRNTLVKCSPKITSAAFRSNLKYISSDSSAYQVRYELQSDAGWNDLVALCDSLTNNIGSFSSVMDADRVMWMLAFNNVLVNLDSYSGAFAQNHYIYRDNTGHYNPVVWDLNMSFGGFTFAGSQGVGMGTLDTTGMQTMSPLLHGTETDWPLIYNVLNNGMYKRMYIAHMRTIVEEFFANGGYLAEAAMLQSIVDSSVQIEPNGFFTYADFQNGLTGDVLVGSHYVPGISNLMAARIAYLQATPEFSFAPPVITNVFPGDTSPAYLSQVWITAHVINAASNAVYLGYRYDKAEKFSRILMYDDGAHGDGTAGDSIFGVSISMSSAQAQYYVYAENNDAGIFSPQRAEHEFYLLNADIQVAQPGEVVINEFLAVNQSDTVDENGTHEDWIELYNGTASPLNLFGLNLSDTYSNLGKFTFPVNSLIQPNAYFMLWADEDNTTNGELHCNFKLSSSGEFLFLSDAAGNILDSVAFGTQLANHSMARCPNGTGPFTAVNTPSFKQSNVCTDGVEEFAPALFSLFPNPVRGVLNVVPVDQDEHHFEVLNTLGEKILSGKISGYTAIGMEFLSPGLYIFSCDGARNKIVVTRN
jgi:spore coat protein CotH